MNPTNQDGPMGSLLGDLDTVRSYPLEHTRQTREKPHEQSLTI